MLTTSTLGLLMVSVVGTSFISGIFGMAGGMVLVGVLLALFDVAPAMLLFGVTQTAANGWRCLLWRRHVRWSIVAGYAVGSLAMFVLFRFIAYMPEKSVIYLGLGLTPFLVELLPRRVQPHIEQRGAPVFCGALIMVFQLIAGVAGNVLDLFFNKSALDRKEIVATKAATQTLAHILRVAYFGSISVEAFDVAPWWLYGLCILLAFGGTTLATRVLNAMTDVSFKRWSRWIILSISGVYVVRGLAMLVV